LTVFYATLAWFVTVAVAVALHDGTHIRWFRGRILSGECTRQTDQEIEEGTDNVSNDQSHQETENGETECGPATSRDPFQQIIHS
jgi:hypothetical protein